MSYLIDKFKGKYRLKVEADQKTKQFNRRLDGSLEDCDIYIDCQYGNKIFHYGRDILQAYIPSLQRGHNIIKQIPKELLFNIEETQSEILFQFKFKDSDKIIPLLKPKTSGASISPFSSKNLFKVKYDAITIAQMNEYKRITSKIDKGDLLNLSRITSRFISDIVQNNKRYKTVDIKADMIQKGIKGKDYIHSIGMWDEYLEYLKGELDG